MTGTATIGHRAQILDEIIHRNMTQAEQVIERVEKTIVSDKIAKGSGLSFSVSGEGVLSEILEQRPTQSKVSIETPDGESLGIHGHALDQIAQRAEIPLSYVRTLTGKGTWGQELLAENFRRIYGHGNGTRYLLRAVDGQLRGFLSDRYKRVDSRPVLEALIEGLQQVGAVPIQGFTTDVKVSLRAVYPQVFEPIAGEAYAYGVDWSNSDFGAGANSLSLFLLRLVCENGAVASEVMRQIHLGGKIPSDMILSQETLKLDTMASVAKVKDVVRYAFSEQNMADTFEALRAVNEIDVDPKQAKAMLKKRMTKEEIDKAVEAFNSPDVVNLPAGNTQYRLSNAVSWISQSAQTVERRLELDRFAGELLNPKQFEVVEV